VVSLFDFITTNIAYLVSLGLGLLLLLVVIFSYQQTRHNGFLLIGIGEFFSLIWLLINLFILQGVYLPQNLSSMGFSTVEIGNFLAILSFISIGISILYTGLLIVALVLFSDKIKRCSKMY